MEKDNIKQIHASLIRLTGLTVGAAMLSTGLVMREVQLRTEDKAAQQTAAQEMVMSKEYDILNEAREVAYRSKRLSDNIFGYEDKNGGIEVYAIKPLIEAPEIVSVRYNGDVVFNSYSYASKVRIDVYISKPEWENRLKQLYDSVKSVKAIGPHPKI